MDDTTDFVSTYGLYSSYRFAVNAEVFFPLVWYIYLPLPCSIVNVVDFNFNIYISNGSKFELRIFYLPAMCNACALYAYANSFRL